MQQTITRLTIQERQELAQKILKYFQDGEFARNMDRNPEFSKYDPNDVKAARHGLINTGMLEPANKVRTSGIAYKVTELGETILE